MKEMNRDPLETLTNFKKKVSQSRKKGGECLEVPKNCEGGPFWVFYFKLEAFGCVQNQVLSTFGKSA